MSPEAKLEAIKRALEQYIRETRCTASSCSAVRLAECILEALKI